MEETWKLKRAFIDLTAGAVSGGISRTVTSPLDVIKIRFQVQLEPTFSRASLQRELYRQSKYTGVWQATKDIFREEGFRGFWRGNVPALLMVMPYTSIQFTVLHKLKTLASGSSKTADHINLSPYLSYVSGALAGCAATLGSYPFDLVRTILASQGEPKVYSTMRSAFVDIVKTRGFQGLYAGLSPTLVEIIPYAGLQFGTYDTFKRWAMEWNRSTFNRRSSRKPEDLTSFQIFLCGLASGTAAKSVCHPLDVVKKRFQRKLQRLRKAENKNTTKRSPGMIRIEGLQRHPKYGARVENSAYKNMYDALRQIVRMEGYAGLYKGIVPSVIKAAPAGAVTFVAYEYTSDWLESILR
ncbi:hypothetical protein QJS04_geneDACA003429 [Acorus gramineus]|uniref:Mitochondrial thiamine pyrophosphate carrier n=1 Tax=Acorus gramineus TaxID=55184 RepID=A0AAV9BKK9_ACOGR|nr:hypothetical protein QJS04_geneDACA003429 [Acorus gramineus]